ncbi:MAG: transglutaminase-like domain-containing protein [Dokdonella sp.]
MPTDGIVKTTATQITAGQQTDIDKARDLRMGRRQHRARSEDARRRRRRCRQHARNHHPSGKCADINALFVALARTANIPARDAYGVRVADSRLEYHCIGRSGDVSKTQHCRAEFYAQSHGWIPVDPADVRKLMLEEAPGGPPATDPKVQSARALLFGNWEMNWIAYNHGHDIALPNQAGKPVPFLMYPNGETAERRLDRLDPSAFRYSITSREIAA